MTPSFRRISIHFALAGAGLALLAGCAAPPAGGANPMSFFVTSSNPGKGGDLGGLAGADAHCQRLASSVGAGGKTWRAYLSTTATAGAAAVDARDRIGNGPWVNAKGVTVATSVANLHSDANNLNKQTAITEKGAVISGRGDAVNLHDMMTGSNTDGRAFAPGNDSTCRNWTSSTTGSAMVGHHDRIGLNESAPMKSWNTSHPSRACDLEALKATGGGGLYYCFAAQ